MNIQNSTIKCLKQSRGLIFKTKFDFENIPVLFFLVFCFVIIIKMDEMAGNSSVPFLFKMFLPLMAIFFIGRIYNNYKNYIIFLNDGIEIRDTDWTGLFGIIKKYKWQDVEYLDYEETREGEYIFIKERNKKEDQSFFVSKLGKGQPSQMSDKPLGCLMSISGYIEFIDFISKENAYTKFVLDINKKYPIGIEDSACAFILNIVCKYNPAARSSQKKILADNNYELLPNFDYEDDVDGVAQAASALRNWNWSVRKSYIELLFKLVVTDDGIKNDEWYLMQRLMQHLGFNQKWQDLYNNRYSPLRTETDYKHEEWSSTSPSSSVASLQAHYDLLGLPASATFGQLQAVFHKLAMDNHPDLPKNANRTAECEEYMTKINEAYEALARNLKQ